MIVNPKAGTTRFFSGKKDDIMLFNTASGYANYFDTSGYIWRDSDDPDGPSVNFIDISSTGSVITNWLGTSDDGIKKLSLPFNFYGDTSRFLWVSTNGFISFADTLVSSYFTNSAIPNAALPNDIIAALWDDLNGNNTGSKVVYQTIDNRFIIQWVNWGRYNHTGADLNFQIILHEHTGLIEFQYALMNFGTGSYVNSHTIGIENGNGSAGIQVVYNAPFIRNNHAVHFFRGVRWLTFNPEGFALNPGESMGIPIRVNSSGLYGGDYYALFRIFSSDTLQPVIQKPLVHLQVSSCPYFSPVLLDFDTLFTYQADTLDFSLINTGTDILIVSGFTPLIPEFQVLTPTPLYIPPGGTAEVDVRFESDQPGLFQDTLNIVNNSECKDLAVVLTGFIKSPPVIEISDSLLIKIVPHGYTDSTEFIIYNRGTSDLVYSISERNFIERIKKNDKIKNNQNDLTQRGSISGEVDVSPYIQEIKTTDDVENRWDVQFDYNLLQKTGSPNSAGVCVTHSEIWVSKWNKAHIWRFNLNGVIIDSFTVTGVTGVRSFAFDGDYVYAGQNTATIAMIDPNSRTMVGTIISPVIVRHISYDPVRNGLWVGDWSSPVYCISKSGSTMEVMTNLLTGKYGSAYDPYTEGGPYLWIWDQGAGPGTSQIVHQFNLNTLTATGYSYNILNSVNTGGPYSYAGGLFITDKLVPGAETMVGILQGDPDRIFGLELSRIGLPWISLDSYSGIISPGDSQTVKAYWFPTEPGFLFQGLLKISSNDPVSSAKYIRLMLYTGTDDIHDGFESGPNEFRLHQNYPNPFNPSTVISYQLAVSSKVSLKIYNPLGQEVRALVNGYETAGTRQVIWDGKDHRGQPVSSGVYLYRLECGRFTKTMKMMMVK